MVLSTLSSVTSLLHHPGRPNVSSHITSSTSIVVTSTSVNVGHRVAWCHYTIAPLSPAPTTVDSLAQSSSHNAGGMLRIPSGSRSWCACLRVRLVAYQQVLLWTQTPPPLRATASLVIDTNGVTEDARSYFGPPGSPPRPGSMALSMARVHTIFPQTESVWTTTPFVSDCSPL